MKTYAVLLGLSFCLSALITLLVRWAARRLGWLDRPGDRKVHRVPTPRLGGVSIFLAFFLSALVLLFVDNRITQLMRIEWPVLAVLPIPLSCIFVLGLVDDVWGLSPYVKLSVEIACAVWVFYHGIFIGLVTNPRGSAFEVGALSLPLTVLWLVGITNAFNLVDGIDGLAAGIALFGIITLVVISIMTNNFVMIAVLASLGGAVAGFLLYNFHPASIFLGDSGSLFLGFTLGVLSLIWGQKGSLAVAVVGPVLLFALPLADAGLAVVRRFFGGVPIFTSDSDHIHHRLMRMGLGPRKVVLVLYSASFIFGLATLLLVKVASGLAVFLLAGVAAVSWAVLTRLGYHELKEINVSVRAGLFDQRAIIGQRIKLRKAADMVGKADTRQELWDRLVAIAQALDFDHVELADFFSESESPSTSDRSETSQTVMRYWADGAQAVFVSNPGRFWKIEVPLGSECSSPARIIFARSLDKGELHVTLDSFVKQVTANVSKGLERSRNGNA